MDSRDSNVQQNIPTFCKNGCGFYANAGSEGLCSVCYKEFSKKKQPSDMPASFSPAPSTSLSNLSSKEDMLPAAADLPAAAAAVTPAGPAAGELDTAQPTVPSATAATSDNTEDKDKEDGKKKKNRCGACKKKVGLTGFTCRCGGLFCSIHRYSDKHECGFDYKAMGAEEISKSNPVVVAQKVAKI